MIGSEGDVVDWVKVHRCDFQGEREGEQVIDRWC